MNKLTTEQTETNANQAKKTKRQLKSKNSLEIVQFIFIFFPKIN